MGDTSTFIPKFTILNLRKTVILPDIIDLYRYISLQNIKVHVCTDVIYSKILQFKYHSMTMNEIKFERRINSENVTIYFNN